MKSCLRCFTSAQTHNVEGVCHIFLQVLYQIMQRHHFIPEAVTADFQIHWGQHLLRPEFVESTYFLYKATQDPHYLEVGAQIKLMDVR